MKSARNLFLLSIAAWVALAWASIHFGAADQLDWQYVRDLRIPRVLLAGVIGAGLAIAGAVLQVVFSNALCEPYTLGISSGSAVGAVVGAAIGVPALAFGLAGSAFAGSLVFTLVLYAISHRKGMSQTTVLLAGVTLGFLGSSVVALTMALSEGGGIQGALIWLLGDLSRARWSGLSVTAAGVLIVGVTLWSRWRELDALLLGEEGAASLGFPIRSIRARVIVMTSLLVSLCVSAGGMIGFVGLIVPHFARRLVGAPHLRLLPLCAVWGAIALTGADLLARTVIRPYELPAGVVTALAGAPVFLWMMLRRHEAGRV